MDFSFPVDVHRITAEGLAMTISAGTEEREGVRKFLSLVSLSELTADVVLQWIEAQNCFRVLLEWRAVVEQECVVTLEALPVTPSGKATLTFVQSLASAEEIAGIDLSVDLEAEDPPDVIVGGQIDVGMLVVEQLALSLDPYPRKQGVRFDKGGLEADIASNPFSVLARLAEKK